MITPGQSSREFAALARDLLKSQHRSISFTAGGASMLPFIRDGEILTVEPAEQAVLRTGDIVLYQRADGQIVAHRIRRRQKTSSGGINLTVRGDACAGPGELVTGENVLGRVVSARRGNVERRLLGGGARLLGLVWIAIQPAGLACMHCLHRLRNALGRRSNP